MDKILFKIKNVAELDAVYEELQISKKLTPNQVIKMIIEVCRLCHENSTTPDNINADDLWKLTLFLVKLIKNPQGTTVGSYLRSIYHIVKLLLEKDSLDDIKLKSVLVPDFLPQKLYDKEHTVYVGSCTCIYNKIVTLTRRKDTNLTETIVKLSHLLLDMLDRLNDEKQYLQFVYNCGLNMEQLDIGSDALNNFYNRIWRTFKLTDTNFEMFLKIFSLNFNQLLQLQQFELAQKCYGNSIKILQDCDQFKDSQLFIQLLEIYDFLLTYGDNKRVLQSSHNSLKTLYQKSNADLQTVCSMISISILEISKFIVKNPEKCSRIVENLEYFKFVSDLALVISQLPYKCSCENCGITTKTYHAFTVINTIPQLAKSFLNASNDYYKELQMYLEKSLQFVGNLQENRCNKWQYAWSDFGVYLFNTGKNLADNNNEICLKFLKILIRFTIRFEGYQPVLLKNYHSSALIDVAKVYFYQKKNYEKSLATTAFNILISPEYRSKILVNWVRYKANCRTLDILNNQTIQELTIPTILEKYRHDILYYDNNFALTKQQKIELLTIELQAYKQNWKSKIPMMVAFKQLYEHQENIGDLVEIFLDIWGNGDLNIHEDLAKMLPKIIKNYQQFIKNDDHRLNLAHLYYLQQKYCLKDAIIKITDDMNKTINFNETLPTPNNPDPDEQCDIVSSYADLKLNRYNRMMRELRKALDLLTVIIEGNQQINYDRIYCLLKRIGQEYRLHSDLLQSIQTWHLALKIANLNNNDLQIMESTGFLIELIDIRPEIEEIVVRADGIVERLDNELYFNEIITYYLCKSFSYFKCDIERSYRIFCEKIMKFSQKINDNCLLKLRTSLLYQKFVMLPCKYRIIDHQDLSKIHKTYREALESYYSGTTSNDSTYEMALFFEVVEQLALMYHNLRMPRELRCYCKDVVLVAQKLLLPYRTLTLLYYLSYADLLSSNLDDCKVKISGIADILCLQSTKITTPIEKQYEQNDIIDRLTVEFNEIMLDVPLRSPIIKQNSPNSPALRLETFQIPSFFYHQENCECFQCVTVELSGFVLRKTLLEAVLNIYQNNTSIARDYCCGGLKIFEMIRNKQQKYLDKLPNYLSPNIVDLNLKIYCNILMEYGNISLRANEIDKALKINEKLLSQLTKHHFGYEYLIIEALLQKFNILQSTSSNNNEIKIDYLTTIENSSDGPKTPESRHNPITVPFKFTPNPSPLPLPKKPIRTKKFSFDDDDDDDDDRDDNKTRKKAIFNRLFDEDKTPAPSTSKQHVYKTRSTVKKQNSKKDVEESNSNSSVSVIEMSPDAYTPNLKLKVQTHLTNRTKILTERLRSNKKDKSKKKKKNDDDGGDDENSTTKTIRKLRYN